MPESVCRFLSEVGHNVTRLRDVMDPETADPVIAVACSKSGHVLVTHDNDFKQLSKRLKITQRQYRDSLHRVQLRCIEPHSKSRFQDALSLVEHEWGLVQPNRPLVIEIHAQAIRIVR